MLPDRPVSDLDVSSISNALSDVRLDVVVSGSIGAVEAVRFLRSLRRIGARPTPWLTKGGARFITPTALTWAAATETRERFSGESSHIALGDACIIAPASSNIIGQVVHGLTETPAPALIASYLGQGKPVLVLPNMHDSLRNSPAVRANLHQIEKLGATIVSARDEEGKSKFPEPSTLADQVAHILNRHRIGDKKVLVTMGSTKGYIDDVRYVSNYSSGRLGSLISEELFRLGCITNVVMGSARYSPRCYSKLVDAYTNRAMESAATDAIAGGAEAAVLAASVLDYQPEAKVDGKIRSGDPELTLKMTPTAKIIKTINPESGIKVGFKLEAKLDTQVAESLAYEYMPKYRLSMMVLNQLSEVGPDRHRAMIYTGAREPFKRQDADSKEDLAHIIAAHVCDRMME